VQLAARARGQRAPEPAIPQQAQCLPSVSDMKKIGLVAVLISMSSAMLLSLFGCSSGAADGGGGGGGAPVAGVFTCNGGALFCSIASELCFVGLDDGPLDSCITATVECRPLPATSGASTCAEITATLPAADNGITCTGDANVGFTATRHGGDCP
jgi:hypothetical protein